MKTLTHTMHKILFGFFLSLMFNLHISAQSGKLKMAILNIDTKNSTLTPSEMGNLVRMELQKLDTFEVMDIYDIQTLLNKEKYVWQDCFGKICLVDVGKILKCDLMLSGSVEKYGNMLTFTLRIIEVSTGNIIKTKITEFINIPNEYQTLCHLALSKLLDKPVPSELETHFIKPPGYVDLNMKPEMETLNLSGPRVGMTLFTGTNAQILRAPSNQGGYNTNPTMFQFGYQFEKQYITSGNFQALFEFIPTISGLEKGMFAPSAALLNGLRWNNSGFELAFGPVFSIARVASGSYDKKGNWHLDTEYDTITKSFPYPGTESRLDSRGNARISASFLFAAGFTIRRGNLNIPINAYIVPNKNGMRIGLSVGYNVRKNKPNTF